MTNKIKSTLYFYNNTFEGYPQLRFYSYRGLISRIANKLGGFDKKHILFNKYSKHLKS
ncbi:MAG: hypothetical protein [Microvirus sp.]|nr:MAG: hypothetical protein [Microvirus sp.]